MSISKFDQRSTGGHLDWCQNWCVYGLGLTDKFLYLYQNFIIVYLRRKGNEYEAILFYSILCSCSCSQRIEWPPDCLCLQPSERIRRSLLLSFPALARRTPYCRTPYLKYEISAVALSILLSFPALARLWPSWGLLSFVDKQAIHRNEVSAGLLSFHSQR